MTITHGVVSVEDGVKANEEYAPARKVRVELSFDVAEGSDPRKVLDAVSVTANAQVRSLLHQAPEIVVKRAETALVAAAPPADAEVNDPSDVDAKIAAAVAKTAARKAAAKAAKAVEPEADPAGIGDIEPDAPAPVKEAAIDEIEPDPEVTDAQVHEAIQKCNARINDTAAIKTLIGSYRTDPTKPFSASMIPQTSRADFLARLANMKAAA